ncbi:MAG: response regulator transcription factor [Firmicutes bacterium]|nr:response regulator transcription factor [Bacillota bacterium]
MIYCVEDDNSIRDLVIYTLQNTGFEARGFASAAEFFEAFAKQKPHLVLLDIMLPDMDGLEILRRIKSEAEGQKLPVIMLTAKSSEYDKVRGLDLGADDYIAKPFGMMELVSRVKAVLRRSINLPQSSGYVYKDLQINTAAHTVTVSGELISLTLKEFALLELLLKNEGRVLTRETLLANIWGYDFDGETRTVDVHVRTLRQKLGEEKQYIETVRGVGYRIGEAKK